MDRLQLQADLLNLDVTSIDNLRASAELVVRTHVNPNRCNVDLLGDLYVEGVFNKEQYVTLMLCQHMFTEAAKIVNYRGIADDSKSAS